MNNSRKEYMKKWQQDNKEKRKEYMKKYHQEHKEILCERAREYYYNNKEKVKEYKKQRRLEIKNNPELNQKMKDYKREWTRSKRKRDKENQERINKATKILSKRYEEDKKIFNANYDFKFILDFEEDMLDILKGEDK